MKSTQLRDAFIGRARQGHDLIGCSETIGRLVINQFVRCEHCHWNARVQNWSSDQFHVL